jgi:2-C-methyl-D-erythritol 4-phosphate cytidylyltransferase
MATDNRATIAVIVPAAGCGARIGLDRNKVLAPLCGEPLLSWTLRALLDAAPLLENSGFHLSQILIAARREEFDLIEPLITRHSSLIAIVEGGSTRQQSVLNAAREACETDLSPDYFLIHDAARPLVSPDLIVRVCQSASTHGAAMAALPASDTVKITHEKKGVRWVESTLHRKNIYLAQTPQVFERTLFMTAFEKAAKENFEGTDCASLIERNGGRVAIVEGEASNIKVTFAADLERAANLLRAMGRVD